MAEISAALVKELRDRTGAPMMDCKRALQETNGDMEAAVRVLREKGMAGAAKRVRPRDAGGQGRLPAGRGFEARYDGRRWLRDRARLEQRRVPLLREEGAGSSRGERPRC